MIKKIAASPIFERGAKKARKKHFNLKKLERVINLIVEGKNEVLINQYSDHALKGSHKGLRELHIEDNWLLVYQINNQELVLYLLATRSYDDVFRQTR